MKKIMGVLLAFLLVFVFAGCNESTKETTTEDIVRPEEWVSAGQLLQQYEDEGKTTYQVKMVYEFKDSDGVEYIANMQFTLFYDLAPETVQNFVDLVNEDFYDGLTIHRIMEDTMIQGGNPSLGPNADESVRPLTIKGEFELNDYFNNLKHTSGIISMARIDGQNNSASTQFFIVNDNFSTCNGSYAAFGVLNTYTEEEKSVKNIDGKTVVYDYEALEIMANLEISSETPVDTIMIVSMEVVQ